MEKFTIAVRTRISKSLLKSIQTKAKKEYTSVSALIRMAIYNMIANQK